MTETEILAALAADDPSRRQEGLRATGIFGPTNATRPEQWITALRRCVRDGPDIRAAVYFLGSFGAAAEPAVLDVARALRVMEWPHQGADTLIAIGAAPLAADAAAVLAELVTTGTTEVSAAATKALSRLTGSAPEVTLDARRARVTTELRSENAAVRRAAIAAAASLGPDAASLGPALHALGRDLAENDASISGRVDLDSVRKVLLALAWPEDDLPHPPSKFQAHRGCVPTVRSNDGRHMIGYLVTTVQDGVVSVPLAHHGVWRWTTGKLLFIVPGAELMTLLPGRDEVAVLRTSPTRGVSRADFDWHFERYALPSGERRSSLPIPDERKHGWPSAIQLTAKGHAVVRLGDEDRQGKLEVVLAPEGDRLAPARATRKRAVKK